MQDGAIFLEWLDALASKVDMYTTEENIILIIGDWNVAPDGSKDRNSSNISRSINTSRAKEAELWHRIRSRLNMVDIFRHFHPYKSAFSFSRKASNSGETDRYSRIDLALCRQEDIGIVKRIAYDKKEKIANTDHLPLIIDLKPEYIHTKVKKDNKPPAPNRFSITKLFKKPEWLKMRNTQSHETLIDELGDPRDTWDDNISTQKTSIDGWKNSIKH